LIGEITKLRDFSRSEVFVWDGKEFRNKFNSSDSFFIHRKVVKSKNFQFFRIVIDGLLYKVYLPGNFQEWFLMLDLDEGVKFSLVKGKYRYKNWIFKDRIWKPINNDFPAYKVNGKIPYWAALITILELNDWLID
jgi:hypothetical protein